VLPYVKDLYDNKKDLVFSSINVVDDERKLKELRDRCQTGLEKEVLGAIYKAGIKLPDESQKVIYDNDNPVVKPDFFYHETGSKGLCVFADGPDHERESVMQEDSTKRKWLKANGYRLINFDYKNAPEFKDEIKDLEERLM